MVRSNSEPEFNVEGHLPRSDGLLVTVHFTHSPEVLPDGGLVESSHLSSSGTRLAQLQFALLLFCLFLFASLGAGNHNVHLKAGDTAQLVKCLNPQCTYNGQV